MYDNCLMRRQIGQYLKRAENEEGLSRGYVVQMRSVLLSFLEHCRALGIKQTNKVTSQAVVTYMKKVEGQSASCQRLHATVVRRFLAHHSNPAMLTLRIRISGSARTTVSWLTEEEMHMLLTAKMSPEQQVLVWGGLLMGLRRIEILRISVRDVKEALRLGVLRVRGKRRKERGIPLHDDLAEVLRNYMRFREDTDASAPLLDMKRTKSESLLRELCDRTGIRTTYHKNRRSWGHAMFERGVPIETIAQIYGHESTEVTKLYIGVNLADMKKALSCYRVARTPTSTPHLEH